MTESQVSIALENASKTSGTTDFPKAINPWLDRARAAGAHMVISALVACAVASLVFLVWFPSPYRDMVGGRELFLLVMGVDLVMGPALTLVAFNRKKGFAHLARDLATIGVLQLAALGYGVHTVYLSRPVHIDFEIDRLRVITAADIDAETLKDAPKELQTLPMWGPIHIASVKPSNPDVQLKSMDLALAGYDLSQQPITWKAMDKELIEALWTKAMPLGDFKAKLAKRKNNDAQKFEEQENAAEIACAECGSHELRAIPLMSKRVSWTALIDKDGHVRGAAPVDMFD